MVRQTIYLIMLGSTAFMGLAEEVISAHESFDLAERVVEEFKAEDIKLRQEGLIYRIVPIPYCRLT